MTTIPAAAQDAVPGGACSGAGVKSFDPILYSSTGHLLVCYNGAWTSIISHTTGRIGINDSTPDAELDVVGDINYTGVLTDVSDRGQKDEVKPLNDSLSRLLTLQGYSFVMKDDPAHRIEYGLIAQEVEAAFPELVITAPDGIKTLNYIGLIAPLVEATKEQQRKIDTLQSEIEALKSNIHGTPR